jgi:hypothetical protein
MALGVGIVHGVAGVWVPVLKHTSAYVSIPMHTSALT